MSDIDIEMLSAYLDGELPDMEVRELKIRLLQEPDLNAELSAMRQADKDLLDYARTMDDRSLPEPLVKLLASRQVEQHHGPRFWAMAAAVLVAVGLIGFQVTSQNELTLDTALSGQSFLQDGTTYAVVASFRSVNDQVCRELKGESTRAIVCRTGDGWHTELEFPEQSSPDGYYQPAGIDSVAALDEYVRRNIQGSVLTRKEEAELMESGWR